MILESPITPMRKSGERTIRLWHFDSVMLKNTPGEHVRKLFDDHILPQVRELQPQDNIGAVISVPGEYPESLGAIVWRPWQKHTFPEPEEFSGTDIF